MDPAEFACTGVLYYMYDTYAHAKDNLQRTPVSTSSTLRSGGALHWSFQSRY